MGLSPGKAGAETWPGAAGDARGGKGEWVEPARD